MRVDNVIDILYEEKEQAKEELKKLRKQASRESWITKKVNQLIRGGATEDTNIWYLERLIRELSEAIKVLEEYERSEG